MIRLWKRVLQNINQDYSVFHLARMRFYSTDIGQPTASSHPHMLKEGEITPGISSEEYISRRKRILDLLPEKSLAIISAAPMKMMTSVVPYFYRQNADYLYITGCQQPGGVAVLGHECGLCMFMPEQTPHDIIWHGRIAGFEAARDIFKADQSYPINKLPMILPELIQSSFNIFHKGDTAIPTYMELDSFRKAIASGKVKDLSAFTDAARWIKSPSELKLMRDSASIGCQALLQSMLHSTAFPHENMLSAKVEYECKMRGAQRMTFHPVVGGGSNGSVIHYSRNDQNVKDGDLVLMDIGCELHGYVSDLTRTWPPCGSFSPIQGDKMRNGLKEIGILENKGDRSYHQLNPTNIGHYLGMDVHDCPTISNDQSLRPGVVITIEPGVYIPKGFGCPERFHGIGIRIEDEVLITESGCEVLTGSLPKEIKHIRSLLNNHQHGSRI